MLRRFLLLASMAALAVLVSLSVCRAAGKPGTLKWAFTADGAVDSSPAIGPDGTVYVGSSDHSVYALDGKTGAKKDTYIPKITQGGTSQAARASRFAPVIIVDRAFHHAASGVMIYLLLSNLSPMMS